MFCKVVSRGLLRLPCWTSTLTAADLLLGTIRFEIVVRLVGACIPAVRIL